MLRILTVLLVAAIASSTVAEARRRISEARLKRILRALADRDIRIRAQALITLGRLRDRRASPRISAVLRRDRRASIRALAAAALGSIGDPSSIVVLRKHLTDRSRRVRRQVRLAIARLAPPTREIYRREPKVVEVSPRKARARIAIKLGAMGAKVRRARRYRKLLRGLWREQMNGHNSKGVDLIASDRKLAPGRKVYSVSSSITQMYRARRGRQVRASCTVNVTLDQNGSIVMMTSGGATIEVSARRFAKKDAQELDRSVLRTAIGSAHRNLMAYLKNR